MLVRGRGSLGGVGVSLTLLGVSCLAVLGASCVADTTVIGDERARYACAAAPVLEAPPWGCVAVPLVVTEPWGCDALAGTWVRFRRDPSQRATIRVVPRSFATCRDGSCALNVHLNLGPPPCTCDFGFVDELSLTALDDVYEVSMWEVDGEVLLEPLGSEVEVQICTDP